MRRLALTASLLALVVPSAAAAATITVHADANGTTVRLHRGDLLVVALHGNASTGYTWETKSVDTVVLRRLRTLVVPDPHKPGAVGYGETHRLRFRARARGTTTIVLRYERPFDRAHPLKTFRLRVVVR
jgi:predicted secreted protein